ncbi:MAG: hypothetical protein NVSMB64_23020 [Candidatus Velthaea sp.]
MRRIVLAALVLFAGSAAVARADAVYRVVVLALDPAYVVLAGGGVLRRAATCVCAATPSGRAALLELDPGGSVVRLSPVDPLAARAAGAEAIPASAFVFSRMHASAGDTSQPVEIRITVTVPARTPSTDDIYVSTEKSGWRPADLLMSRIDARRWTIVQTLPRGARFAYRFTRGSFMTGERNAAAQLPPARELIARPSLEVNDDVARWADIE